jgi:hypothetical protein
MGVVIYRHPALAGTAEHPARNGRLPHRDDLCQPRGSDVHPRTGGFSSYAANAMVFVNSPNLHRTIRDGTSNTIGFAEHYSTDCQRAAFGYPIMSTGSFGRRATFADEANGDAVPSGGKVPQLTFQVAPSPERCWPFEAQTPHHSGMLAALMDGSCRTLAPSISASTYWAAVTPSGGEAFGPDW